MYYLCYHFQEITEIETRDTCILLTLSHFRPLRCPLAQRAASGSGTRPCRGPSANAAAVFPPCGVWTPPPRGRQRDTLQSIRQDSDCAALFRLPCVCAAVWPKRGLLVAVAGVCWRDGTGQEAAGTHVWRLCQREICKNSKLFVLYFLLLKSRYKVELHYECCPSCKEIRKTPKHDWNGALTLITPLLLLKLSMKQTVIAWRSQQCSSCRLNSCLCCFSEIPWRKITGPSDKALWFDSRLWALKDPGANNATLPLFIPLRSLVLCFLISFAAVVILESSTLRFSVICSFFFNAPHCEIWFVVIDCSFLE